MVAGPVKPPRASALATAPAWPAQPGCTRLTQEPSSRCSSTPEAKLPAMPSAAVSRPASRRSRRPAVSAAAKTPHTDVACQPRAWKTPEAAMPSRAIDS